MSNERHLLSTAEVAALTGVSPRTVNRWVREGRLTPAAQAPGPKGARLFNAADLAQLEAVTS
jgi:excisionase family DNA binding protein